MNKCLVKLMFLATRDNKCFYKQIHGNRIKLPETLPRGINGRFTKVLVTLPALHCSSNVNGDVELSKGKCLNQNTRRERRKQTYKKV